MADKPTPDDGVINLPRSEWRDWTGAEDALSKLARTTGAQRHGAPETSAGPDPAAPPGTAAVSPGEAPAPKRRTRASRVVARYLIAIGIGIVGTLAWQAHGDLAKRMAADAVVAMWQSPTGHSTKQRLADVWTSYGEPVRQTAAGLLARPASQREPTGVPAAQTAAPIATEPAAARPAAPAAPQKNEALAGEVAALRKTVEQMTASQEQMAREIARLEAGQTVRQKSAVPQRWHAAATRNEQRRSRATSEP